jgi:hypothetical protein
LQQENPLKSSLQAAADLLKLKLETLGGQLLTVVPVPAVALEVLAPGVALTFSRSGTPAPWSARPACVR